MWKICGFHLQDISLRPHMPGRNDAPVASKTPQRQAKEDKHCAASGIEPSLPLQKAITILYTDL